MRAPSFLFPLLTLVGLLAALSARGEENVIEAGIPGGRIVSAEFHAGKPSRPAVIVLHGFLQTRDFPTVAGVKDALVSAGYTVLAPTLSLGVSRRHRSLPCEAVHTHSLSQDVDEIAFWTRWIEQRGHDQIVLVGHSFGSVQILSYLGGSPSPAVRKAVLVSLSDVEVKQPAAERARTAQRLRERIARGDRSLAEVELGHCRKYVGPPVALLSYLSITRKHILEALAKAPVPVEAIMGGNDDRTGADWPDRLRRQGIAVRIIEGANHFYDAQYEFDLHDAVLQGLASVSTGR